MLSLKDESRGYNVVTEASGGPRNKRWFILLLVLSLVLTCVLGIVIGYFIGRSVSEKPTCEKAPSVLPISEEERKEFHKHAVEQVSTEKLRAYLK